MMKTPKQILLEAKSGLVKIGHNFELWMGGSGPRTAVHEKAKRALKRGETVVWENGTKQWVIHEAIINIEEQASAQFIWNKAGEKAKHNTILHTKLKNGETSKKIIGTSFREF